MRVLLLGPVPPPHGGVQANMSAIAERLRVFGHEAALVAVTRSDEITNEANVYHPRSVGQLLKILARDKADIVHLHFGGDFTPRLAALGLIGGVLPGKKSVLTFHSGGFAASEAGLAARVWSLRGFAVRRLDKIIAVNREIAGLFERYGVSKAKIEIVAPHVLRQPPEGVKIPENIEQFCAAHSPLLFTASWLEPHYDLPLQIEVLGKLKKDFPRAGLLVAGSGWQENELKNLINATDHASDALLAGDVAHEAVLHLIKRADALLRTTHFDGDAISVREALFLGTPVVASDNRMRPENVTLFPIGDADGLHRAITETLKNGKKPTPTTADDFSNIDKIIEIYESLISPKSAAKEIKNQKSKIKNL